VKRHYAIYYALIGVLVVANLGRWWLAPAGNRAADAVHSRSFLPEDFRLRVDSPLALGASHRDLFHPGNVTAGIHPVSVRPRARIEAPPPAPVEMADADLDGLKLLGVVFRGGKGKAYLSLDKESVIALPGETAFGRFLVDSVAEDAVNLRDLKTNTTRRIPVSGK
jgi:hypothetical protein